MGSNQARSGAIHIALTFDDKFWAPAYATMRSICLSSRRRQDLVFHLCHLPIPDAHRDDLDAIQSEFGARVIHYDLSAEPAYVETISSLHFNARLSYLTYARFFLDRLIDAQVERLIYIDCDFLVLAPIEELAETDLRGNPLGAVKSPYSMFLAMGRDMRNRRDIFDAAEPYFNAGILVIDMPGWRAADLLGTVNAVLDEGRYGGTFTSQPYLNLAFRKRWTELDWRWNVYAGSRFGHEFVHPKAVHYVAHVKPWYLPAKTTYKQTYRHVMTNELFYRYFRYRWRHHWRRLGR